jgi:lipid A ethanolaminephosphotransferase
MNTCFFPSLFQRLVLCFPPPGGIFPLPRPVWSQEILILAVSLWFTLACNTPFWRAVLQGRAGSSPGNWGFSLGTGVLLTALDFLWLGLSSGGRRTLKPLLALFLAVAGVACFYMGKFGIYLDPDMLKNVLHTDFAEAGELLTWDLLAHLAIYLLLPLFALYWIPLAPIRRKQALLRRGFSLTLALFLGAGGLALNFQGFAALMRNHKEVRYLATPGNAVYSLARRLGNDARTPSGNKQPVGSDAVLGAGWWTRPKPALFMIVVGETARAANWGLHRGPDGALRHTTPELEKQDIIPFAQVTSCGTSTEVSLPCMFSMQGRRHYNEKAIRDSESLLHVLNRAGFRFVWRDNQAGCKGVCSGLEQQRLRDAADPRFCGKEGCLDEILLQDLGQLAADTQGNLVLALHTLGNHGPAYYRRYPETFRRLTPTCDTPDLGQCSREQIVNSYDNALLYTDDFLSRAIDFLKEKQDAYDTALIYVSDHGESLGENGLFLHGVPYAIAPAEQIRVPMLMWFSPGYLRDFGLDADCLRQSATHPASHDNLFHSVLGLLDVSTQARDPARDLSAACRRQAW